MDRGRARSGPQGRRWPAQLVAAVLVLGGCAVTEAPSAGTPPASGSPAQPSGLPTRQTSVSATVTPSTPAPAEVTSTPSTAPAPLAGRTIVVDPGHNAEWTKRLNRQVPAGNGRTKACNSSGTATNDGWGEHAYTWAQAIELRRQLKDLGAEVVLTRPDDKGSGPCVNVRAATANDHDADLLISIHADGDYSSSARGYHIIISTSMAGGTRTEKKSRTLAAEVRRRMDTTGMPRSTYIGDGTAFSPRSDIATLNLSQRPGIMMEMGNMRHTEDVRLLRSKAWRAKAATALAEAAVAVLD